MKATLFLLGASFLTGADAPPAPVPEHAPAPTPVVGAPVPHGGYGGHAPAPVYHGGSYGACGSCGDACCEEKSGFFSRWKNRSYSQGCGGYQHSCNSCTGCGTYAYTDFCDTGCSGGLFGGGRLGGLFGRRDSCGDDCGGRSGLFGRLFKRSSDDCCESYGGSCHTGCDHGHHGHHGHYDHGHHGHVIQGSPGCGVPHVNPIAPPVAPVTPGTEVPPKTGGEKLPEGKKQTSIPSAQPLTIGTRSPF